MGEDLEDTSQSWFDKKQKIREKGRWKFDQTPIKSLKKSDE